MPRYLRWIALGAGVLAGLALIALGGVYVGSEVMLDRTYPKTPDAISVQATQAAIAEGRHLVTVAGCTSCHGSTFGGNQLPVPGSTVYCPNLTLLGKLSNADIDRVLRQAIMPDGTSVIAMPSHDYAAFTDREAASIIAYLRSLKPRGEPTPALRLGLIMRIGLVTREFNTERRELLTSKAPIFVGRRYAKGRHLAQVVCSTCHASALTGESNPAFTTPDLEVIAAYERPDFHAFMHTGKAAGGRDAGLMSEMARDYFSNFTDAEIDALYDYLTEREKVLTTDPPSATKSAGTPK